MTESSKPKPPTTIASKMARVMSQLKRLPKNGHNSHFNYDFATNEDVMDTIRPLLASEGIMFLPSILDVKIEGKLVLATFNMKFIDGETSDTYESQWYGQAVDTGDKGIAKCATSATKYYLLKTFLLSAGDEPDIDTDNKADTHNESVQSNKQYKQATEEQHRKLRELVDNTGQDWEAFAEYVSEKYQDDVDSFTFAQADYWIKRLSQKSNKGTKALKEEIS